MTIQSTDETETTYTVKRLTVAVPLMQTAGSALAVSSATVAIGQPSR